MLAVAIVLTFGVCFLAYSNGSNDNFKGVATLFGSGTTDYRRALFWATATTFAGAIGSVFLAETLVNNFSGKGLVPDSVAASPEFLQAVVLGAGLCVLLASVLGFPISTTHSLIGGLVGAGFMAAGAGVNLEKLASSFFLPLLLSPVIAIVFAGVLYSVFHRFALLAGVTKEWCVCIGQKFVPISPSSSGATLASIASLEVSVADASKCIERYTGSMWGVSVHGVLDTAHYLSAGVVSFARGLNDTPKIVAALIGLKAVGLESGMLLVAVAMAIGGLLQASKVAKTMSKKITPLNHGQGFTANLVTGLLVVVASRIGMPVSTTHVVVGSLFGIGTVTGKADKRVVVGIVTAWVCTLPLAAAFAAGSYWALSALFGNAL